MALAVLAVISTFAGGAVLLLVSCLIHKQMKRMVERQQEALAGQGGMDGLEFKLSIQLDCVASFYHLVASFDHPGSALGR